MKNSSRYNFIRFFLFFVGVIPSIMALFLPRSKNRIIFSSEFNNYFNHSSKYLFLFFLKNKKKEFEVFFVINDNEKRQELISIYGPYFISTYTFSGILKVLCSYTWITSSIETPVGGFFLRFRRLVIHLSHGAPIKNVGLSEKYANWKKYLYYSIVKFNFTHFFSSAELFDENWNNCLGIGKKRIKRAGLARNDVFKQARDCELLLATKKKSILYAPTWRPFSSTKIFPFSDLSLCELDSFLEKSNAIIYLRLHPNFENSIGHEFLLSQHIKIIGKDVQEDINEILPSFDLLITDYSSIYVDFLLMEKPLMFLPYDLDEYKSTIGLALDYDLYTPGPKPENFSDFISDLRKLLNDENYFRSNRISINNILNPIKSNFSEQNANVIIDLINK